MKTTIDKAGRVVIPASIRAQIGLRPGIEIDIFADDISVRLVPSAPGPRLERKGNRWVARPTVPKKDLPVVDVGALVEEERNRWPW